MSVKIEMIPQTETKFHMTVVEYLRLELRPDVVFHHSPNEGKHKVQYRVKQKKLGVRPGWPDLEFMFKGQGFFIELKLPGGRLSANQLECHRELSDARCPVVECFSLDEVIKLLGIWGLLKVPVRAQRAA